MKTKRVRWTVNLTAKYDIVLSLFLIKKSKELKLHSYTKYVIFSWTIYLVKIFIFLKQDNKKEYKYILKRPIYINII